MIVKRWVHDCLPPYEQDFFWAHTRMLRESPGNHEGDLPEGLSPGFVAILNMIKDGLKDAESGSESERGVSKEAGNSDTEEYEEDESEVEVHEAEDGRLETVEHSDEYDEDEDFESSLH